MIIAQHQSETQEATRVEWVDYLEPIIRYNLSDASDYAAGHLCGQCHQQLIVVINDGYDAYQLVCPQGHVTTRKTVVLKREIELMAELGF